MRLVLSIMSENVFEQQSKKIWPRIIKSSKHDGSCQCLFVKWFWIIALFLVPTPLQMQKNMWRTTISVQPGSGRDTLFQLGIQSKLRFHRVHLKNQLSVFYFLSTHMSNSGWADQWQRIGKHPLDRKQALGFPERRRRGWQEEEASQGWAQPCWDTDALWATTWRLP